VKLIDYIFKNLDVDHFLQDLKKNLSDHIYDFASLVIKNTWDINSIKKIIRNRISLDRVKSRTYFSVDGVPQGKKRLEVKKDEYYGFIKKYKNNLSDKNIISYFKDTNIRNTWSNDHYEVNSLFFNTKDEEIISFFRTVLSSHLYDLVFFKKLKGFENFSCWSNGACLQRVHKLCSVYYRPKNLTLIFDFYRDINGINDSYDFYQSKGKINYEKIIKFLGNKKYPIYREYTDKELEDICNVNDEPVGAEKYFDSRFNMPNTLDSYYTKKQYKNAYNFIYNHKHVPIKVNTYSDDEYFDKFHYKRSEFVLNNPKKYFDKFDDDPSSLVIDEWTSKPKQSLKKSKLFQYLMTNKKGYSNNKDFILSIMYHCNDIKGFMDYLDPIIIKDKSIMDELHVLSLFRNRTKSFIIKVIKKNKAKIESLVSNYVPKHLLDDPTIMMALLNVEFDTMMYMGPKLKKNKKFMSKVNKMLKAN
tara:strand:- start:27 stop:1442 length:1416 start_codon:yes stop_codon:yes gene_type:complete